jgi:hypothetical protein
VRTACVSGEGPEASVSDFTRSSSALLALLLIGCTGPAGKGEDTSAAQNVNGNPDEACPIAKWDPSELTWTNLARGVPETQSLTILNDCSQGDDLSLTLTVDGAEFTASPTLARLSPGEATIITVTAVIEESGPIVGTLEIASNDPVNPSIAVTLTASGVGDNDEDGYVASDDCDDNDAAVNPGEDEIWYDGVDQDCDGNDADQDGDGFPLPEDCDDEDARVNPGETETWYDGVDQDCDGRDDDQDGDGYTRAEDCDDEVATAHPGGAEVWYDGIDQDCDGNDDDQDGDGFALTDDCNDEDAAVNPDATETWYDGIDQDCDGNDTDQDGDGFSWFEDCDDEDASVNPDATETWYDGIDQNCDGANDDDQDSDGFEVSADCDDEDASVNPGEAEIWYDGIDQDCDGSDDDQDGDGFARFEDCDDEDASVNPDATETWYDGIDQDCDGNDDDRDGDGYAVASDCNDGDASVNPGATEVWYDGIDQDCDGESDYDQDKDGLNAIAYGGDDCDDTDPTSSSGSAEVANGIDDDCDGDVDEGLYSGGEVIVVEVMSNPALVSDAYGEWFEVYNTTGTEIDLYNWEVSAADRQTFTITSSVPVPAYGYAVLGVDADSTRNGGLTLDYAYARADFSLVDTDSIKLSVGATVVDSLSWTSAWPHASGISMILDPDHYGSGSTIDEWCESITPFGLGDLGTPTDENDICPQFDHDGDGYSADDGDCDDEDAAVYPGAFESDDGLDTDCDGVEESGPTADAGYSAASGVTTCSPIQLDGSGSTDPEGTLLTFSWELTGAPPTSALTTDDIFDPTDESPYFYADVAGSYTFTLVVSDGGAESMPDSLTITVLERGSNSDPVAAAGADQTISGTSTCTPISYGASFDCDECSSYTFALDAAGSSDADGDQMSYSWTVTGGASYATLSTTSETGASVMISGAPASYGSATNTDVTVQLTATDCYGATDTDSVKLTYACTGS